MEYSSTVVGQYMKNIAQTHLANFGSRVLYTTSPYNSFDTHANQAQLHSGLWSDVSNNVETFMADLRDHDASDNVMLLMFTEFGRRISDNGSGTDHGAGGVAFAVGEHVKGGIYGEYPSLEPSQHAEGGNLQYGMDFRTIYSTILEDWLHMDSQTHHRRQLREGKVPVSRSLAGLRLATDEPAKNRSTDTIGLLRRRSRNRGNPRSGPSLNLQQSHDY